MCYAPFEENPAKICRGPPSGTFYPRVQRGRRQSGLRQGSLQEAVQIYRLLAIAQGHRWETSS